MPAVIVSQFSQPKCAAAPGHTVTVSGPQPRTITEAGTVTARHGDDGPGPAGLARNPGPGQRPAGHAMIWPFHWHRGPGVAFEGRSWGARSSVTGYSAQSESVPG